MNATKKQSRLTSGWPDEALHEVGRLNGELDQVRRTLEQKTAETNAIATATNVTLVLTPAVTASGNYRVVVSNAIGTATNFSALTVTKATLTVTANNTNRVYATSNPVFTASYTGWVNGDTLGGLSGAPSLATTATSGSSPGNYVISAANGTLAATNYNFTFVNGTLAVVSVSYPTNLTFTADSGTLTLSWPASHLGWTLQAQTNTLNSGIGTNWVDVANSTQTNHASITANPNLGTVFYRLRQ